MPVFLNEKPEPTGLLSSFLSKGPEMPQGHATGARLGLNDTADTCGSPVPGQQQALGLEVSWQQTLARLSGPWGPGGLTPGRPRARQLHRSPPAPAAGRGSRARNAPVSWGQGDTGREARGPPRTGGVGRTETTATVGRVRGPGGGAQLDATGLWPEPAGGLGGRPGDQPVTSQACFCLRFLPSCVLDVLGGSIWPEHDITNMTQVTVSIGHKSI